MTCQCCGRTAMQQIEILETELSELQRRIEEVNRKADDRIEKLGVENETLVQRIRELEAELSGLQSRASIAQHFRDKRIAELEAENARLRAQQ